MTDAGEKTCPECAETVKAGARKCRFCGADLTIPDYVRRAEQRGKKMRELGCQLLGCALILPLAIGAILLLLGVALG